MLTSEFNPCVYVRATAECHVHAIYRYKNFCVPSLPDRASANGLRHGMCVVWDGGGSLTACVSVLHTYARAHTHTHTHIHTYIHVPTQTHIHRYTDTHTYIHTHTHTHVRLDRVSSCANARNLCCHQERSGVEILECPLRLPGCCSGAHDAICCSSC